MSNSHTQKFKGRWKVHVANLFEEIVENNPKEMWAVAQPLNILKGVLVELGERAAELNDPILNELMCRLTIYDVADPHSENYNQEVVETICAKARTFRECATQSRRDDDSLFPPHRQADGVSKEASL